METRRYATNGNNTASSVIGGGQLGYNWQTPDSPWVFGIEGDIDAQDFHRDFTFGTAIGPFMPGDTFSVESHWPASLRGRIGYAVWDRSLLYATGGVAWTQVKGAAQPRRRRYLQRRHDENRRDGWRRL